MQGTRGVVVIYHHTILNAGQQAQIAEAQYLRVLAIHFGALR
jgi:hypothetical protein